MFGLFESPIVSYRLFPFFGLYLSEGRQTPSDTGRAVPRNYNDEIGAWGLGHQMGMLPLSLQIPKIPK
jgi:hypothetical protein